MGGRNGKQCRERYRCAPSPAPLPPAVSLARHPPRTPRTPPRPPLACRNHLRPELNKGEWTVEEDLEILRRVQQLGTKWAQISAHYLPDRTENDVKNRWNSVVKKMDPPAF